MSPSKVSASADTISLRFYSLPLLKSIKQESGKIGSNTTKLINDYLSEVTALSSTFVDSRLQKLRLLTGLDRFISTSYVDTDKELSLADAIEKLATRSHRSPEGMIRALLIEHPLVQGLLDDTDARD